MTVPQIGAEKKRQEKDSKVSWFVVLRSLRGVDMQ
jgi:hypothetical protein